MMRLRTAPLVLLLVGAIAQAQDKGDHIFNTLDNATFGDPRATLRDFLRSQHIGRRKPIQNFCVVAYQDYGGNEKRAWVHWPEGHKLILWTGGAAPLARSRRIIDLTKDVVASDADVNSSTYLVTQAWADQVIADCATRGVPYQVRP